MHQVIRCLCGCDCDSLTQGRKFAALSGNAVQKWKIVMPICHPVTSQPLIFLQKEAVLSPRHFATTHLRAVNLNVLSPFNFATHEMGGPFRNAHRRHLAEQIGIFIEFPTVLTVSRRPGWGGGQNVPNARWGRNSPQKLPLEDLDFGPSNWRFSLEFP